MEAVRRLALVCDGCAVEGLVRKKRRVELHIERREISVFAGVGYPLEPVVNSEARERSGLWHAMPAVCPLCGSSELMLLAEAVARPETDLAALNLAFESGEVHAHRSADGDWWVCKGRVLRREQI